MNRRAFLLSALFPLAAKAAPAEHGIRFANGAFVALGGGGEPYRGSFPPFAYFGVMPSGVFEFNGDRWTKISEEAE